MEAAARSVRDASSRLERLKGDSSRSIKPVHAVILDIVLALTNAVSVLIKCATAAQQDIVAKGRGSGDAASFYKKNHNWSEGLISAAKTIATATGYLVETADGLVLGTHRIEQLAVASHEVSAGTAQLVAAARVKADVGSQPQRRLEEAAKGVTDTSRKLVEAAKSAAEKETDDDTFIAEINGLSLHQFKVQEMNQQVKINELENRLAKARKQLGEMRKAGYAKENENVHDDGSTS